MIRSPRFTLALLACGLAVLLAVFLACGDAAPPTEPTPQPAPQETDTPSDAESADDHLTESEIQALEALGYLDHAMEEDDPRESGVLVRTEECECDNYLLVTYPPLRRVDLIDRSGETLRMWSDIEDKNWERAVLTAEGHLLLVAHEEIPLESDPSRMRNQRLMIRRSFGGPEIWKHRLPTHHLATTLPDGRITALTSRSRSIPDRFGGRPMADNGIAIFTADGTEILEERSIYDALAGGDFEFQTEQLEDGRLNSDFIHSNHFHWMPGGRLAERSSLYAEGNVMVTLRKQDTVAIIDFDDGDLLWTWGRGEVVGMHDAKVLDSGNVLIFDNRSRANEPDEEGGWSRVVEVDPLSEEIVWEYRADPPDDFYSHSRGTVHRLPGGNTLIASSNQGRIFEVTPEGEIAWDFWTPRYHGEKTRSVLRAEVYPREFVESFLDD